MSKPTEQIPKDLAGSDKEPQIRFGNDWIPAHQAWGKMETAHAVVDAIEHFNTHFPKLASAQTRAAVPTVRQRLKDIEMRLPRKAEPTDYSAIAREMLARLGPEEALDELANEHQQSMNLHELIHLAGEKHYLAAMQREAMEFEANRILAEQTATIWNEMSRPAPGGGLWTQRKVEALLQMDLSSTLST